MSDQVQALSFDNTRIAFKHKGDQELKEAYWLFRIIGSNFLVNAGPPLVNLALKLRLPIEGLIRKTVFKHFCGGETIEGCDVSITRLAWSGVGTILDYSVEGGDNEKAFDTTCEEILKVIDRTAASPNIPFAVFKITGLGRFALLEKVSAGKALDDAETEEYKAIHRRVESICVRSHEKNVRILIDAEHSWIQELIDRLAFEYMSRFNREQVIVYNTYQLYRYDKLQALQDDFRKAEEGGFMIGAKLVRGAYMEQERERAVKKGYPSPIHTAKADTDRDYDAGVKFCLQRIDRIGLMIGTHNEQSCLLAIRYMEDLEIARNHGHIYFAQLLGMSDNLSFNLADAGYRVAKYMPYGPVRAVMPYLFRRAQENTSVAGQAGRELTLIEKEIQRRKVG